MQISRAVLLFCAVSLACGQIIAVLMDEAPQTFNCGTCITDGMAFTPQGCQPSCLMDTWCYTSSCPELTDIDECFQCHAFGGDYQPGVGCNFGCELEDVECFTAFQGECPPELILPPLPPDEYPIGMELVEGYDRFACLSCVADGSVFTPSGCQETCLMDTWCITSQDMCVSNCEMCVKIDGKKFTPDGCQNSCLMDTWCYTDSCPAFQNITLCAICDRFGGFYLEDCTEGDASSLPSQGCPDLSQIDNCEECVAAGGRFIGELTLDQQGLFCAAECIPFLPVCLTECE